MFLASSPSTQWRRPERSVVDLAATASPAVFPMGNSQVDLVECLQMEDSLVDPARCLQMEDSPGLVEMVPAPVVQWDSDFRHMTRQECKECSQGGSRRRASTIPRRRKAPQQLTESLPKEDSENSGRRRGMERTGLYLVEGADVGRSPEDLRRPPRLETISSH